jgi:hypothetical protein
MFRQAVQRGHGLSFLRRHFASFVESAPNLLTRLHTNILLSCGLWKDYSPYMHNSTFILSLDKVGGILGMKHVYWAKIPHGLTILGP